MELPVETAPGGDVLLMFEVTLIFAQHRLRLKKISLREMRNGGLQYFRLEQGSYRKEFLDVGWRQRWSNRPPVGNDCD